jgi:outer membrane protein assembly factor BamB
VPEEQDVDADHYTGHHEHVKRADCLSSHLFVLLRPPEEGKSHSTSTRAYGLSGPTVTDGVVYVGSEFGKVYAVDAATGRLRWIYTTGEMQDSLPAVAHGTVYVGSDDAKVFALKASPRPTGLGA